MVGLLLNAFSRGPKDFAAGVELRAKENMTRRLDERDQLMLEQTRRENAAAALEANDTTAALENIGAGVRLPNIYNENQDGVAEKAKYVKPGVETVAAPQVQAMYADVGKTVTGDMAKPGGNPVIMARNNIPLSRVDLDYLVRTIYGEARGASADGHRDVANVILNRSVRSGKPVRDVVLAKSQFEPWGNRKTRREMLALKENSPAYQRIAASLQPLINGQVGDTTNGATLFLSPGAQRSLGRNIPAWADPKKKTLERDGHQFFTGAFVGDQRRSAPRGLAVPKTPPTADEATSQTAFVEQSTNPTTAPQVFERWSRVILSEPERPNREIQMQMQRRAELVKQAQYAAMARKNDVSRTLMAEIRSIDNNMVMLHGMQGVQEARLGAPEKLLATLTYLYGREFSIRRLSNGNINLLVDDQIVNGGENIPYTQLIEQGLTTFNEAHRTAAAALAQKAAEAQVTENAKIPGKQLEVNAATVQNRERIAGENQRAGLTSQTSLATAATQAQSAANVAAIQGNNDLRKASFEAQLKIAHPEFEIKEVAAGPDGGAMVVIMNKGTGAVQRLSTEEFRKFLGKTRYETSVTPIETKQGFN